MKTTLDLPDSLLQTLELQAQQSGESLQEMVTDLLRRGLASRFTKIEPESAINGEKIGSYKSLSTLLAKRKQCAQKFIDGEWGTGLEGYEAGRNTDREAAKQLASLHHS